MHGCALYDAATLSSLLGVAVPFMRAPDDPPLAELPPQRAARTPAPRARSGPRQD